MNFKFIVFIFKNVIKNSKRLYLKYKEYIYIIMIIPICCFTCGKQIAHLWERYLEEITKESNKVNSVNKNSINKVGKNLKTIEKKTLDKLRLRRYCCRRMILTHIDVCEKI